MNKSIPDEAVEMLIQIGKIKAGEQREALLARVAHLDTLNRLGSHDWRRVTESLSEDDHQALAKGLVIAEEHHRWSGGSVAAAIWVFGDFRQKFPNNEQKLADWMLAHSSNSWVPFGSDRGSARSVQQLQEIERVHAQKKQRTTVRESARAELKAAQEAVRKKIANYRTRVQQAASEARHELLKELEALPANARLEHLAWDNQHPLSFYPISLISEAEDAWTAIAPETRDALLARASAEPRGEWHRWWREKSSAGQSNTAGVSCGLSKLSKPSISRP